MGMNVHRNLLAAVAAIGLVGAGAALRSGSSVASANPSTSPAPAAASGTFGAAIPTDGTIANVAECTMDSVVQIAVSGSDDIDANPMAVDPSDLFGNGGDSPTMMGKGSGVIVNASGRILTNAHVVNGFKDIKVTLSDGSEYDAKVVGKDPKADLAVVQLQGTVPALKPVEWADSSKL